MVTESLAENRIPLRRAAEEAELHVVGRRIDVGDRNLPSTQHPLPHFHGLLELRSDTLHELPQGSDDVLIPGSLACKVLVKTGVGLHLHGSGHLGVYQDLPMFLDQC